MYKRLTLGSLALLLLSSTNVVAGVNEGGFTLSPMVGAYVFDGGDALKTTAVLGLRGGYNINQKFTVEALFDYIPKVEAKKSSASASTMSRFGGQLLYHFCDAACSTANFIPYAAAGISGLAYSGDTIDSKITGAIDYGMGANYYLADSHALRADVRVLTYSVDGQRYDVEALLGYTFQFGGVAKNCKSPDVPLPEPVKIVAAPKPVPEPVKVVAPAPQPQAVPEPVKTVASPATVVEPVKAAAPAPLPVPVPPIIAAPVPVAAPVVIDSDMDGVPDNIDKCPDTPRGAKVDATGCPVDSDKDGVPDYLDKCPNTAPGTVVDANGCAVEAAKKFCDKPAIIEIAFDTNKSDIKPVYYNELDKLGAFLKEFPSAKGTIEGHSDSDGNKEANIKLSQARAGRVRDYIVNKFKIEPSRISAIGYGPVKPVASNKTVAGKAKNRRIEAKFSCE